MNDVSPYQDVIDLIYTCDEQRAATHAIEQALDASYDTKADIIHVLDAVIPYTLSNAIVEAARARQIDLRDNARVREFFTELTQIIKNLQVVDLRIAFHPTKAQIRTIAQWFRREIAPHAVLNLTIDPGLVAGAVIGYGGKLYDLSIQQDLHGLIQEP